MSVIVCRVGIGRSPQLRELLKGLPPALLEHFVLQEMSYPRRYFDRLAAREREGVVVGAVVNQYLGVLALESPLG